MCPVYVPCLISETESLFSIWSLQIHMMQCSESKSDSVLGMKLT